jgi:kynurenine formamidase
MNTILDLTLPFDERVPVFPGDVPATYSVTATIPKNGWNARRLNFPSHYGTHIDAPFHMWESGKKLHEIEPSQHIGQTIVIDVSGQQEIKADLSDVKEGDMVFFYTGHIVNIYQDDYFDNYPVISLETAQALLAKGVKLVGLDSFTPDAHPYAVHKLFFQNEILIVENLCKLDKLRGMRFHCVIAPLPIMQGDGAPCRVFAFL